MTTTGRTFAVLFLSLGFITICVNEAKAGIISATLLESSAAKIKLSLPEYAQLLKSNSKNSAGLEVLERRLRGEGKYALGILQKLVSRGTTGMNVKWSAFQLLLKLDRKNRYKYLETGLSSRSWFIRAASARYLGGLEKKEKTVRQLVALLNDSSLVVRTAAVKALGKLKDPIAYNALASELYNPRNFRRGKSMWIRKHIVSSIASIRLRKSVELLVNCLDDQDRSLYAPAMKGLSKITGKRFKTRNVPSFYGRQFWKKWWKKKNRIAKVVKVGQTRR